MEDNNKSEKEVVVITGGSAGLGRAIANEFARHGAKIALIARGKERLEQAKKEVEELGGEAVTFSVDVSDAKQLDAAAALVEEKWGPIDIWINNAMVGMLSPVKDMKPDEYKRITEVTYLGQVYGAMAALKRMLPRDKGTIIMIGSALAYRGIPLQAAYCGAKHATQGFLDSLRSELIHEGSNVKVSMVQMPAINTPQFDWVRNKMANKPRPMGTPYQPEVCAKAVYYAAHHPEEREYKVGSSSYIAILGNKIFPGVGDWYLGKKGFKGQQTDEVDSGDRPDNLFEPVPGNYGAHGRFDEESKEKSTTAWLTRHQTVPAAAALLVGAVLTTLLFRG
ncbi:SDR family oxidoreductase [Nafulsella turpanensis]|uniref:SDR family oxidoreductase n=1 Tax=Nafulsella turpanensis TaxID=1265690 RepID=UPI0003499BBA|nr:SDR family oxidoreductase [Nafulsella turpanensis]